MIRVILTICYILLAPLIGGLLDGPDRKISARMQRRVGAPLLQPFYDVSKLLTKRETAANKITEFPFDFLHGFNDSYRSNVIFRN